MKMICSSSSSFGVVIIFSFFLLLNFQNFVVASVRFLNLSEILQPKLQQLEVEFKKEKWAINPTNVFESLIGLLASEYRGYKCNERKSSSACNGTEQFENDLSMENEAFVWLAEKGKTDEIIIGVTKKFISNLKRMPNIANSNWHFLSASDRQIYNLFVRILTHLSSDLDEGIEREVINEYLQNSTEMGLKYTDLTKMTMKLWIVMFSPKEDGDKTDWNPISRLNDRHNGNAGGDANGPNVISTKTRQTPSPIGRHRRRRRASEMVKHIAVLGVSLCASYFGMTSLKRGLEKTLEHFDRPVTIFGTAVLLYLGTLYMFERRKMKKNAIKKNEIEKAQRKEEAKTQERSDSVAAEASANQATVNVMDMVSYKQFMEELYGMELDIDDVRDHYKDYRMQMEQSKGTHPQTSSRTEHGSSSYMANKRRYRTEYGTLDGEREENDTDKEKDKNKVNDEEKHYQPNYKEYLKYMKETINKVESKKKRMEEIGKRPKKGMSTRLAMPRFYESNTKGKKTTK